MRIINRKLVQKKMYIITAPCWACDETINIALINGDVNVNNGQVYGPELFTEEEVKIAESNDVIIKMQHSKMMQEDYRANTCKYCNTFIGQHYLFKYFCGADYGDYKHITIDL